MTLLQRLTTSPRAGPGVGRRQGWTQDDPIPGSNLATLSLGRLSAPPWRVDGTLKGAPRNARSRGTTPPAGARGSTPTVARLPPSRRTGSSLLLVDDDASTKVGPSRFSRRSFHAQTSLAELGRRLSETPLTSSRGVGPRHPMAKRLRLSRHGRMRGGSRCFDRILDASSTDGSSSETARTRHPFLRQSPTLVLTKRHSLTCSVTLATCSCCGPHASCGDSCLRTTLAPPSWRIRLSTCKPRGASRSHQAHAGR